MLIGQLPVASEAKKTDWIPIEINGLTYKISKGALLKEAVETHTVTLTNTDRYPFNNSAQTIALDERRNTLDYSVEAEVLSHVGTVGDVVIYDKQTNGFKVKFEGSGKAAKVLLKITGGL